MSIVGDTVVSAISTKLHSGLGTRIKALYKNPPIQGTTKPYIFIKEVSLNITPELNTLTYKGKKWLRADYTYDIIVFPDEKLSTRDSWLRDTNLMCLELLEYIDVEGTKCKALNISSTETDGILHIMVEYRMRYVSTSSVPVFPDNVKVNYK